MTEFQITYWRDLPSLVVARAGEVVVKAALAARLQEAIDEAAMRTGSSDADSYLAGWRRSDWMPADGTPADVCAGQAALLEDAWPAERVTHYLADRMHPPVTLAAADPAPSTAPGAGSVMSSGPVMGAGPVTGAGPAVATAAPAPAAAARVSSGSRGGTW